MDGEFKSEINDTVITVPDASREEELSLFDKNKSRSGDANPMNNIAEDVEAENRQTDMKLLNIKDLLNEINDEDQDGL